MKNYFILLSSLLVLTFGCKTKEVVGPQGPQGQDALTKQGSISGTLYGKTSSGDTIIQNFKYEYITSIEKSSYSVYNPDTAFSPIIYRRSLTNDYDYFEFDLYGIKYDASKPDSNNTNVYLNIEKSINDSTYISFNFNGNFSANSASKITYSNYQFTKSTGALKFDFKIDIDPSNSPNNNAATVIGTVDVNVKKEQI